MTNDMTKGNPVRLILAFMIPTYLGNIFQQFYNLVDLSLIHILRRKQCFRDHEGRGAGC